VIIFFSDNGNISLIPSAHADGGGIIEWNNSLRIVTTGDDGATTYVWDYEAKTQVRKYYIKRGELKMDVYTIEKEEQ